MVRNPQVLAELERRLIRAEPPDFFRSLQLYEAMYEEAKAFGVFPLRDPLDGLDVKIRVSEVFRVSGSPR